MESYGTDYSELGGLPTAIISEYFLIMFTTNEAGFPP